MPWTTHPLARCSRPHCLGVRKAADQARRWDAGTPAEDDGCLRCESPSSVRLPSALSERVRDRGAWAVAAALKQ